MKITKDQFNRINFLEKSMKGETHACLNTKDLVLEIPYDHAKTLKIQETQLKDFFP